MRKEVISNKETHEDPVVYTPLKVEGKRQAGHGQLSREVLKTCKESRINAGHQVRALRSTANVCSCTHSSVFI